MYLVGKSYGFRFAVVEFSGQNSYDSRTLRRLNPNEGAVSRESVMH